VLKQPDKHKRSSSNLPWFARNSNTGGEIAHEAAEHYRPAINRMFHDTARLSRLILPIIDGECAALTEYARARHPHGRFEGT
jgi:hypothetical protein